MKRLLVLILSCAMFSIAIAQNSAVDNAVLYHKDGSLDQAKKEIDQAVAHEKTISNPKAWYYKGVIYADILKSKNASYKNLSADPLKEAIDALLKAKQLDASKGQWYQLADSKLKELWAEVINKGIAEYEEEKLQEAKQTFEFAQRMMPEDTAAYIYGSYAAEALDDKAALKKYSEQLIKLNYKTAYVYRNLVSVETDPARKIEIAKNASSEFPQNAELMELLGDSYSEAGKTKEALNTYSSLNSWKPGNVTIMTKLALQHQKLNENDKALELYEKINSIDKKNFLSRYNAAIIYYEKGKEADEKVHKLNMDEYHKKGKQMEEEVNSLFAKAKEHASIALNLTTDESDIKNIRLMLSEIEKKMKK
jgi:tetratricopeptide (TPR) repeat protein